MGSEYKEELFTAFYSPQITFTLKVLHFSTYKNTAAVIKSAAVGKRHRKQATLAPRTGRILFLVSAAAASGSYFIIYRMMSYS